VYLSMYVCICVCVSVYAATHYSAPMSLTQSPPPPHTHTQDPRLFSIKEHSFLLNPQTPQSLVQAADNAPLQTLLLSPSHASLPAQRKKGRGGGTREGGGGGGGQKKVSEEEVLRMFGVWKGEASAYASEPVLKFSGLEEVSKPCLNRIACAVYPKPYTLHLIS